MFEKIMKFGCGFIVIYFVVMICFGMCSSFYLFKDIKSSPEITMMSSPKTLHISKFKVDEVLEDGSAVAHVEDFSSDIGVLAKCCFRMMEQTVT